MFKKAFTMVELVFVIIIIGIMSAVLAPNFKRDNLTEASNQIISHIRYTEHLAMMDNKFNPNDPNWYKKRWQIKFRTNSSKDYWWYVVYSDISLSGNPNSTNEVARDPSDLSRYLIGWQTSTTGLRASPRLDLTKKFGIKDVKLSNSCNGSNGQSKAISFDYLSRPFQGNPKDFNSAYENTKLITSQCKITLTDQDDKNITIAIEPETGYVHLL